MEELILNTVPIKPKPCKTHKPFKGSYLEHLDYMERKERHGAKQRQCKVCGYWLFKSEVK